MSDDASKKLRAEIELVSTGDQGKPAVEALKKITDQTKEGNEMAEASGKLTSDLSDKTKEFIKSLNGATESGEKFHLTGRKIGELARDLVKDMPQVGEVLREITDPWLGLTFAIGAVVAKMIEYETQIKAMEDRPGPDWEGDATKLADLRKGYEEAALAANKFSREMDLLVNKERTPQEKGDEKINKLKELAAAEGELMAKQRERDEAGIAAAEQLGLLTHAQAVAAKLNLDEEYTQKRIALEAQARNAEIFQHGQELEADKVSAHIAREQLPGAQTAARSAHAAEKSNADKTANDQSNLEKALKERETLQGEIADLQLTEQHGDSATLGIWTAKHLGANIQSPAEARKMLEDRYASNERTIGLLQQQVKKGQDAAPGLEDSAAAADEKLDAVKEKLKALQTRINELDALLPAERASANLKTQTAEAGAGLDAQTADLHALPALANTSATGHAQLSRDLNAAFGTMNRNTETLIHGVQTQHAVAQRHSAAIAKLTSDIEKSKNATFGPNSYLPSIQ